MLRKAGLVAAWMVATVVSIFIASQAVGGVGDQVTDSPATLPEVVAAPGVSTTAAPPTTEPVATTPGTVAAQTTTAPAITSPVSTAPPPTVPPAPTTSPPGPDSSEGGGSDDPGPTETTNAAPATSSTTSTSTSTTSTTALPFEQSQHHLTGGVVVLKYRPGEVFLVSASPNPGYEVKVGKSGPISVEVEFQAIAESDSYEGELHAEWRDGQLEVDIEEHESGDD